MKGKRGIIIGLIGCVTVLCLVFLGIATSHNAKKSSVITHTTKKSTSSTQKSGKSSSTTTTTSESSTTQEQVATPAQIQTETEIAQPAQATAPSSTYTPGVGGLTAEDVTQDQQAAQDQAARKQWHDDQVEWAIQNGYYDNSTETKK